jgi:4'-phosphopantetheinyl transferase
MHFSTSSDIHLWLCRVEDVVHPALWVRYHALLTPAEATQASRFVFDVHRKRYLVTRALVRTVLSRYLPQQAPQGWRFTTNAYGCPQVADLASLAPDLPGLRFNLSHTDDMVVLAIRPQGAVGVDIETWQRSSNLDIADHYFSKQEAAQLRQLEASQQHAHFTALWTLKESYIKARTMGLAIALDQVGFALDTPGRIDAVFEPALLDDPQRWQFWQLSPSKEHVVALCAQRSDASGPITITTRSVVPLWGEPITTEWREIRRSHPPIAPD